MFSRLPQKLPFGILNDEAKLAFRSQPSGIAKLASTRVSPPKCTDNYTASKLRLRQNIPETDSYWDQVSNIRLVYLVNAEHARSTWNCLIRLQTSLL